MTPVVHSVTEAASVESVVRLMTRKHIHRVIVRKGRKVAGRSQRTLGGDARVDPGVEHERIVLEEKRRMVAR